MNTEQLVRMANQIGGFFETYVDQVEASIEIAGHIKRNWAACMRKQLLEHVDNNEGVGLKEIVLSSIKMHRSELEPRGRCPG
jgi:formate dehydrogenase subunit delta